MKIFLCIGIIAGAFALFISRGISADTSAADDPTTKRKLMVTLMIWDDVEKQQPGSDHRKELLAEFLDKSNEYLSVHSEKDKTAGQIWTLRALAACELGHEVEARRAGKEMLALGMDKSESRLAIKALAFLERKGWLNNAEKTSKQSESALKDIENFEKWKPLAELGETWAEYNLGWVYDNGRGVTKDEVEAVRWYRKAAEQGYADAQNNLGVMYEYGTGVTKNDIEAIHWYRKAEGAGNDQAFKNLELMYSQGRGVSNEETNIFSRLEAFAYQNNVNAELDLAMMYAYGRGVAKNEAEAEKWLRRASDNGSTKAQETLKKLKIRKFEDAKQQANAGDANAQNSLGLLYAKGADVTEDDNEAVRWFRKAADQGNADAQNNLGWMYANGRGGVTKDEAEAVRWYRKAAEQGNTNAQEALKKLGQ